MDWESCSPVWDSEEARRHGRKVVVCTLRDEGSGGSVLSLRVQSGEKLRVVDFNACEKDSEGADYLLVAVSQAQPVVVLVELKGKHADWKEGCAQVRKRREALCRQTAEAVHSRIEAWFDPWHTQGGHRVIGIVVGRGKTKGRGRTRRARRARVREVSRVGPGEYTLTALLRQSYRAEGVAC